MNGDLIIGLSMLLGLLVYTLIAKWYVAPRLRSLSRAVDIPCDVSTFKVRRCTIPTTGPLR